MYAPSTLLQPYDITKEAFNTYTNITVHSNVETCVVMYVSINAIHLEMKNNASFLLANQNSV